MWFQPIKNWLLNATGKLKQKVPPNSKKMMHKFLNLISKPSIRKQLVFYFLLISLGPILIIGLISYNSSRQAIKTKIEKYSLKSLSQTVLNIQMRLEGIENFTTQFFASQEYNTVIKEYVEAKDEVEKFYKHNALNDLLQAVVFSNKDVIAIMFMSKNDPTRYLVNGSINTSDFLESFPKSKLSKKVLAQNGRAVWSPVKIDKDSYHIVMAREVKTVLTGESLGVVIIFIDEKALNKAINNATESGTESKRVEDDYTLVIDNNGAIISSPFTADLEQNIAEFLANPEKMKPFLAGKDEQGSFTDKFKGQNVLVTYQTIGNRDWNVLSVAKTNYLYQESNRVGLITFIFGIIFGVIAIFISFFVASSISNPLKRVVHSMQQAENGDFTVRAHIKNKDELGFLGASFDHMIEKIGDLLRETKTAIDAVLKHSTVLEESSQQSAKTAEAVAMAMEEISKGTMEQTTETEKSSVKMTDLATQIEVVVSKANEVEQISGSTRELSLKSKDAVEQLIIKTNETDLITETIVTDIIELNKSAEEIRSITGVISGIAEQTNLLALNAAIEAARAGDMGQGFAVVAEEVNKLAVQSRDAAKTINNILKTIQVQTQASGKTAEQAHLIIEDQRSAVQSAKKSFDEITTATGDIIGRIIFMNNLITNINNYKNHTVQSIVNISSISEETAASAEEVTASTQEQTALAEQVIMLAQELRSKAEHLAEVVNKFQI